MSLPPLIGVLAGGSGTRFWPVGRTSLPKQLLPLAARDKRALLNVTLDRVKPLGSEAARIIAPRSLQRVLRKYVPEHPAAAYLWEPKPRNTAGAVALAAFAAAADDDDRPVLIVPADHHVRPLTKYRAALKAMVARARQTDAIVTLGLTPDRPATGYGYLQVGRPLPPIGTYKVLHVDKFVEKPKAPQARRMVDGGKHLWNGGTFAFRARVFLDALAEHLPDAYAPLGRAFKQFSPRRPQAKAFHEALARAYRKVPSISVDFGVMEQLKSVETVAVALDWDDLGSWDAVARHRSPNRQGNQLRGSVTAVDATGNLVDAGDGHVALLGVDDLIVVRTEDAVLVAKKGRGEDVRAVVEALKRAGREDLVR